MTDRELMQQALDALFNLRWAASERDKKNRIRQFDEFMDGSDEAIEALRARLAQPEPDDGYCQACEGNHCTAKNGCVARDNPPLQREWQGLTKQDWHEIWEQFDESSWEIDEEFQKEMVAKHGEAHYYIEPEEDWKRQKVLIEKLVEAKLKEKNNAI